jgi:hypothetical protein
MNRFSKMFVFSLALASACAISTAQDKVQPLPVISITQVDAKDAETYAVWIARMNEVMKTKTGAERTYRVYVGDAAGHDSGVLFAVSAAESFVALSKTAKLFAEDPDIQAVKLHMNAIREMGSRSVLKAVRFEGTHAGGHIYNSQVVVTDEAAYLKALDGLRALLDAHGMKDVKINTYRVIAGRTDYTHLVSINTASSEKIASVLDAVATEPWMAEWLASLAKMRTVVRNGTYHEITR